MAAVTIEQGGKVFCIQADAGESLMAVLRREVPAYAFPCGGNHTCGKCMVTAEGALSPMCEEEKKRLPEGGTLRLACAVTVLGDCRVSLRSEGRSRISKAFTAELIPGEALYAGRYGAAVDIGTTTVVAYLFEAGGSQPLAVSGRMNAQRAYGSDVLSRIVACDTHSVQPMQKLICDQLGAMLDELCLQAGIGPKELSGCCVTGNTTMLHILTGLDPHGISLAPFRPESLFGETRTLPIPGYSSVPCYLPPCISAYVGGDISCSIVASGLLDSPQTSLLIDAGTNGEIALLHEGGIFCCSTAAGPAFEGANISCGMQAEQGAIDRVWAEDGALRCRVIGGGRAAGLCGSGLIDAVSAAFGCGLLDKKGRPGRAQALQIADSGVQLTRKDISELLLAKAAIRAGIETLLEACGIEETQVARVILCGGFGSYLNVQSACGIGMLPASFAEKTCSIGNAAGAGAAMALQNRACLHRFETILSEAQTIELSASKAFTARYVAAMSLR